jgi:hypothetical protein
MGGKADHGVYSRADPRRPFAAGPVAARPCRVVRGYVWLCVAALKWGASLSLSLSLSLSFSLSLSLSLALSLSLSLSLSVCTDGAEGRRSYASIVSTLARLHTIDLAAVGLTGFGRAGGYYERQLARLQTVSGQQEQVAGVPPLPHLQALVGWYRTHLPTDHVTLVHGDYKFDNVIFHPTENRVVGVLDWEMATVGHPFADVANLCMPFYQEPDYPPPMVRVAGGDGIPAVEQLLRAYCAATGHTYPFAGWPFCISFAFFRVRTKLALPDPCPTGSRARPCAAVGHISRDRRARSQGAEQQPDGRGHWQPRRACRRAGLRPPPRAPSTLVDPNAKRACTELASSWACIAAIILSCHGARRPRRRSCEPALVLKETSAWGHGHPRQRSRRPKA